MIHKLHPKIMLLFPTIFVVVGKRNVNSVSNESAIRKNNVPFFLLIKMFNIILLYCQSSQIGK